MIRGTISASTGAVRHIPWRLRRQFGHHHQRWRRHHQRWRRHHRRWRRQLSQTRPDGKSPPLPGPSPERGRTRAGFVAGQSWSLPRWRLRGSSAWCWPLPWVSRRSSIWPTRSHLHGPGTRPAGPWRARRLARRLPPAQATVPVPVPARPMRARCRWRSVGTEPSPALRVAGEGCTGTAMAVASARATVTGTVAATATETVTARETATATETVMARRTATVTATGTVTLRGQP